jgi:nucleotide-binding universal stress UspA family protein
VYGITPPGGVGEEYAAHREALRTIGRTALEAAVEAADDAGVPTTLEVVDAKPAEALLAIADRYDARVIVVGTWGESPLRGAMLGSTPHKLLHLSSRPVLCVPAHD